MKRSLLGALLAAIWLGAPPAPHALTVQEAILRVRPAVALITARVDAEVTMDCGDGLTTVKPKPFVETGTGWFVDGRGWLITNAHVVDPVHRLPPWVTHELKKKALDEACLEPALRSRGFMPGQRPDVEDRLRRSYAERAMPSMQLTPQPSLTVLLSNGMSLPATVRKFSPPPQFDAGGRPSRDYGRDLALLSVPPGRYPAIKVAARDAKIGDAVRILGFPGVVLTHELLNQSATVDASVTNGAVSGYKVDQVGQDLIQTDAPAAHGNSGGPAISDDAEVVGVMMSVSLSPAGGSIVQGFNFLIPARDVLKFLRDTEVRPGESEFTAAWGAGLDALFAERYRVAVQKFRQANEMLPNLTDVKRQLADGEAKLKNPPPRPFPWALATLAVTLVSVGAYGGMLGRRWWKNRYRVQPTQVIAFIERGLDPLLVDARTKTDYETSPLTLPRAVRLAPEDAAAGRIALPAEPHQLIVTYCTSREEQTSAQVAQLLRQRGFTHVRILKGGLGGWTNARLPVEAKSALPSIGLEIYKNLTLGDVERRRFKAGEVIFTQGSDAHAEAYVVHAGSVEIRKSVNGNERLLNTLHEGDLFGQVALFRKAARSASAVAHTEVELLVIKSERLEWMIFNRPQLAMEVLKQLSELVVSTDHERGDHDGGPSKPS